MNSVQNIRSLLNNYAALKQSTHSMFFKTAPGEYAEHDKFIGVSVPIVRKIAKDFTHISLEEINCLLQSKYNEERLLALFILVARYKKSDNAGKAEIYQFYLKNIDQVNNWNLVDSSAHLIIGAYLWQGNRDILVKFAGSGNLWYRRIAIIATLYFIRQSDVECTFEIAKLLLYDTHDLIHKAVGWMLREAGKIDESALSAFLDEHALHMPRTILRYAIEKFPQEKRLKYLKIKG